jgi:FkbM family methyltransferase
MKKIFLDCGSHSGESVNKFRSIKLDSSEYEIHMFEPNPILFDKINNNSNYNNCIKNNVCVSNKNGKFKLWGCTKNILSVGSTLERSKANFDNISNDDFIECDTIDLIEYIKNKFDKNDYIILKLDVEGSEYDILEKMLDTNVIDYINELHCEFHHQWLDSSFTTRYLELEKKIKLKINYWDALQ